MGKARKGKKVSTPVGPITVFPAPRSAPDLSKQLADFESLCCYMAAEVTAIRGAGKEKA